MCAIVVAYSPARGADADPDWRNPLPGTAAFLGAVITYKRSVVCDTTAHLLEWWGNASSWETGNFPGCKKYPPGVPVIIEGIMSDPPKDTMPDGGVWSPLAKIQFLSQRVSGYTILMLGVRTNIPQGTLVHLKSGDSTPLRLAPSQSLTRIGSAISATH
jgi:hypothetical protein